jgi:ribosomal protein S6 kinase alpha-5
VFLVRKNGGSDDGQLYAMKVLQKAAFTWKGIICAKTERRILEAVRRYPFLATLHYAFQTNSKLCLVVGKYKKKPPWPPRALEVKLL